MVQWKKIMYCVLTCEKELDEIVFTSSMSLAETFVGKGKKAILLA